MDISAFLTKTTDSGAKNAAGASAAGKIGNGVFMGDLTGISFMDLIFARLNAAKEDGTAAFTPASPAKDKTSSDTQTMIAELQALENPTAEQTALLDQLLLEQAVVVEPSPATDDQIQIMTQMPKITNDTDLIVKHRGLKTEITLNEDQKAALMKFFEGLTKGTPKESMGDENAESILSSLNINIQKLDQIVTAVQKNDGIGFEDIQDAIGAFVVNILPPKAARKEAVILPRGNVNIVQNLPQNLPANAAAQAQSKTADIAAKLNSLNVGDASGETANIEGDSSFDDILRILESVQTKKGIGNSQSLTHGEKMAAANAAPNAQQNAALNSAIKALAQSTALSSPALSGSFEISDIFPEGFDISNFAAGKNLSPSVAQMTSFIGNVQQAGHPHPASQMVSVSMNKAARAGGSESRDFTIQLDPPDLGKVQIKMQIGTDKKVQAQMLIEKPETWLMLQRDAQLLERALQDAGLDTSGDALSFELAQDGNLFDHDQKDQGGNSGSGGGRGDAEGENDEQIIETTMDWYVDPDTGLTRYNLLV